MPYHLINRKAGGKVAIDGKIWELDHYKLSGWILRSKGNKDKTLYIADICTGSIMWDKITLEYVLNRRLYKVTAVFNARCIISRVATAKDLARSIRALARNIEKL